MATCKGCLHYEACVLNEAYWVKHNADQACHAFKDKSKYVEQKHGHWLSLTDCSNAGVYCSVCQKKVWKEDYAWCNRKNKLRSNYCPNCGAKNER